MERIGGKKTIQLDVRVLATSNRDLMKSVQDGTFREDLYYRLCVFPLECLPLRQRVQDILPLAEKMITTKAPKLGVEASCLSDAAQKALCSHPWPGNVRELENTLQRAMILQTNGVIEPEHLGLSPATTDTPKTSSPDHLEKKLAKSEAELIDEAIEKSGGSKKKAAELLGISPRTLRYKMAKIREQAVN